jgi:hypothetical protein
MSFDNSRFTFDPRKSYSGVVMEQGRVQTDADWNEWLSEVSRRIRAGTLDTLGHAVYPATTPYAFQIAASNSGGTNSIRIGVGRMYLDGILAENHGDDSTATWDSALEEMSNSPLPSPLQALGNLNSVDFAAQPYSPGATAPSNGQYLAYLDVWRRPVTYIEDPSLVDIAIGVDTSGRLQTAWQVGLVPVPSATVAGAVTTAGFVSGEQVIQANTGASAYLVGTIPTAGPMTIGPVTGTPDATDTWVGQTSGAIFTPTALALSSNSTVTGTVTNGAFQANEQVIQATSGASAYLVGPVSGPGPMMLGPITGTPDATDTWVGQISGAVFTPTAGPVTSAWSCSTPDAAIPWPATSGVLSNGTVSSGPSGPCCLSTGTGYTGVENQFYRVEIHTPGISGGANATFKWSRENASVQTGVTGIAAGTNTLGDPANVLTVLSLGRDQVLGFAAGNWIEITNEQFDDNCLPGELYKIDSVDVSSMTITLTTQLSANFPASSLQSNKYTLITRWDQSGKIYKADNSVYCNLDDTGAGGAPNGMTGIPVPTDGTKLILENGITVDFGLSQANGEYLPMDYWNFSARTADGSIDKLDQAPPRGIHHHYTKLSIVTFGASASATDCRQPWPSTGTSTSSGACGCRTYTVGDGVTSFGMYTSIQQAVLALDGGPGEVCILPGSYYENVLLQGLEGVVIHGCEWQTYVYSKALQTASGGAGAGAGGGIGAAAATQSGLPAVFTLVECRRVELRSLHVGAADDEIGILMDRPAPQTQPSQAGQAEDRAVGYYQPLSEDIILEDLEVTASTLPAIVARGVQQLKIAENQISMSDVRSLYSAVYLSGQEMFFVHNQVGLREALDYRQGDSSQPDQPEEPLVRADSYATLAPGGIQIAGPSKDVFILENSIKGGRRNGVSLGNFIILDENGEDTQMFTGLQWKHEDQCGGGGSGSIPGGGGSGGPGSPTNSLGAGGIIRNLYIERNQIQDMGMSGIGPVGFFDMKRTSEVVSLVNVNIIANTITNTLQRNMQRSAGDASAFGYGVIGMPDVEDLIIRDNTITNYGVTPGAEVCGIFVLHGQSIEISRNQVRETRDLARSRDVDTIRALRSSSDTSALSRGEDTYGGMRAGIYINLATPLTVDSSAGSAWEVSGLTGDEYTAENLNYYAPPTTYAPGIPALRIQENQVRVALGLALSVRGTGPFAIVNNQFSTGGTAMVRAGLADKFDFSKPDTSTIGTDLAALTVSVMNLGIAIEALALMDSFSGAYKAAGSGSELDEGENDLAEGAGGAVMFTNNICELDALRSRVRGFCSVVIVSLDHILFANNHLRVNAAHETAFLDALLFGISLHATANRFQESPGFPVYYSAMTAGLMNSTSQNISTYCIRASGMTGWKVDAENVVMNSILCRKRKREIVAKLANLDVKGQTAQ